MRTREGEHPWGDAGQLALLGLFLVVWAGDSFVFRATTRLGSRVPLAARLALSTASVAALALTAGILAFYDRIASFEERWLEDRHGEAYRAYRQHTGRWWPRP